MNPLNRQWFYRGFRNKLRSSMSRVRADAIWAEAGGEYMRILAERPALKHHKGAMTIPAVALYRALKRNGEEPDVLLNRYGEQMGMRFARVVHGLTSLPGVDRFIWKRVERVMERASSEEKGYRRQLVSEPPDMYGVDILSCPFHEIAKELGEEKAVLCICHMDKAYSQGFHHIRYDRFSALGEGDADCAYRLRYDEDKD